MKVLVTGASGGLGKLLVKQLEYDPNITKIIGLSHDDLNEGVEGYTEDEKYESYLGDTRKKRVEEVFQHHEDIDVMVHLAFDVTPGHDVQGAEDTNVFGTVRMIELARKHGVRRFVYKSPAAVYGANGDNPTLMREDSPLRGNRADETERNEIEADMTCQMNMYPDMFPQIVILRVCGIIGKHVRSPLNTFFRGPFTPIVLGFDPMFQIVHESDVVAALALAVTRENASGVYNAAGKFTEPLSEVIHRLGKISIPLPEFMLNLIYKSYFMSRRRYSFPFDMAFIKQTFAVDDSRIRRELGYKPKIL